MPERIGPAPNGAERANSRLIQYVQDLEIRVDCLRAFDINTPSARRCRILLTLWQMRTRPRDSRSIRRRRDIMLNTALCAVPNSTAAANRASLSVSPLGLVPSVDGAKIANNPPANPPCCAIGRSNWPLPSPSRNARGASLPPRWWRRNRTSLWPSKIGTRRGDVIRDAPLQKPSRVAADEDDLPQS